MPRPLHTLSTRLFILLLTTTTLTTAALATGCGSDNTNQNNPKTDLTTPPTFEEYIAHTIQILGHTYCQGVFECPEKQPPSIVQSVGRYPDQQACIAGISDLLNLQPARHERTAIKAGRLIFDAEQARKCLNELNKKTATCLSVTDPTIKVAACDNIYVPQQQQGQPCEKDKECTSNHCQESADHCYGTCAPPKEIATVGEKCDKTARCADDLLCVWDSQTSTPICVEPYSLTKGGQCNGYHTWCEKGLVCHQGTCTEPFIFTANGEPCDLDTSICRPGLTCADITQNGPTITGTCQPTRTLDQPCQDTKQCAIGLYCDAKLPNTGVCRPPKAIGQPCPNNLKDECAPGSTCNTWPQNPSELTCGHHASTPDACVIPDN